MKLLVVLAALLSVALANPIAEPQEVGVSKCYCEPPICPLELIAECKCKNAAAQTCYDSWLAKGVKCPKPVPQVCETLTATIAPSTKYPTPEPTPTLLPNPLRCGGIAGLQCSKGFECIDDPRDDCDPKKGGADCIGFCVEIKSY